MDEPDIQDSPTVWWPIDRVADIISKRVTEGAIDTVGRKQVSAVFAMV